MATPDAEAAATRHGRSPGVRSRVARSLALDLLDAPKTQRRAWLHSLDPAERARVFAEVQRETGTLYACWHDDPYGFVEDVLGETMWGLQREVMDSIALPGVKRVIVPAGFGIGKTFLAGRMVAWAGAVNPVGAIKIPTTATRMRQVRSQLWPHIKTAVAKGKLPGHTDTVQWVADDMYGNETQIAYGFSAAPTDEAAMQGIHGCYSSDVEILTNEGWKFFPDVRGDEQVMSLRADGVAEWGPITEVTNVEIDGYLNVHDGTRVNFSVTDGHRMLWSPMHYRKPDRLVCPYCDTEVGAKGRAQHEGKHLRAGAVWIEREWAPVAAAERRWQLGSYMDLPQEFFVRRTNTWEGTPFGPVTFAGTRSGPDLTFQSDQFARFLGWYVAEGRVHERPIGKATRRTICVAQMQGDKYEQITALLDEVGVKYVRTDHSIRFLHKNFALWLQEHCGVGSGEKRVPKLIMDAPQPIIRAFLDTYRMGDGTRHTHPDSARYVTSSKLLADDIHELLVKMGTARKLRLMHPAGSGGEINGTAFTRKRDVWVVTEAGRPADSNVKKANVSRVRHQGPVYCVTTPNETLMVRRNGTPMWCGNTPKLLLVVDEAGGIAPLIGKGTNNLLTGDAKMLAIGNPSMDEPGSWFERISEEGLNPEEPSTLAVRISTLDSPAITGEVTPLCRACVPNLDGHTIAGGFPSHLPDRDWMMRTLREWGVMLPPDAPIGVVAQAALESGVPYLIAKVLAMFPKDSGNQIMPSSWVEAAEAVEEPSGDDYVRLCDLGLDNELDKHMVKRGAWIRLGVDVASDGGDELAVYRSVGDMLQQVHVSSGSQNADAMVVAEKIAGYIDQARALAGALGSTRPVRVKVDGNGLGWGVVGVLKRWTRTDRLVGVEVVSVMVSESPEREDESAVMRPYRKRDEMFLAGRFLLQPDPSTGFGRVRLRVDHKCKVQLSTVGYSNNAAGYVVAESKGSMKKRGLSSPDRAEAALLAVYEPMPVGMMRRGLLN